MIKAPYYTIDGGLYPLKKTSKLGNFVPNSTRLHNMYGSQCGLAIIMFMMTQNIEKQGSSSSTDDILCSTHRN